MTKDREHTPASGSPAAANVEARPLPEAAKRALAEAEERRRHAAAEPHRELDGRGGLDPARYGDWEVKGIAVDF